MIFTIANQKGGVGKTTTAVSMAVALAEVSIPTLLIDMDPQANATSSVGLGKTPGQSLYLPLRGQGHAAEKIVPTSIPNLHLIPAELDLTAIEIELSQRPDYLLQLRQLLQPLRDSHPFRVIIIDCPPALGLISMNALAAADHLLIALQCEYMALEGLGQILGVVDQLHQAEVNPQLTLGGILMTMFDSRTNLSRQVVEEVRQHFPKLIFQTLIPRSIRLGEAPSFGQTILQYDGTSLGAQAYRKFTQEVIKRFDLSPIMTKRIE